MSCYAIRSVCKCGWWHTPHNGSEFFSSCDFPCCPKCGEHHQERTLIPAKVIKIKGKKWWNKPKFILEEKRN